MIDNDKAVLGAIGENMVVTKLMENGWAAMNINSTIKNFKSVDILALKMLPNTWEHKTVLIQVKTLHQYKSGKDINFPTGFDIEQSCDKQFLEDNIKGPYVFVEALDTSDGGYSFDYYVLSRKQMINLLYESNQWYCSWPREKEIKRKGVSAGLLLSWIKGEDTQEKNGHSLFQNPISGNCHNNWRNIDMKKATIMGAIVGDTIGSVYEFNPTKNYNFQLFYDDMEYTDDSIMTIAVADWAMHDKTLSHEGLVKTLQYWGRKYPDPVGAYGGMFSSWLRSDSPQPYNSWGNGSAMRVSATGFIFDTLEETLRAAQISAEVTHNHPEGIKGAQATAAAIFMARTGKAKKEIAEYIEKEFGYNLHRSYEEIKDGYHFEGSCQETVPQSIIAFLASKDYEDAIRLTIALGGDADTMGAITGAIAAAFYGEIPSDIYDFAMSKLPEDLKCVVTEFEKK